MSGPVRAWVQTFDALTVRRLERAIDRARRSEQAILPLFVSSYGGSVGHMMAMVDLIDAAPCKVATIAVGMAQSCGAVLLACGSKGHRYVGANVEFMVHPMNDTVSRREAPEVVAYARQTEATNAQWLGLLDRASGKRTGWWRKFIERTAHHTHYMTPADAVKHGLADHIGVPRWKWTVPRFEVGSG